MRNNLLSIRLLGASTSLDLAQFFLTVSVFFFPSRNLLRRGSLTTRRLPLSASQSFLHQERRFYPSGHRKAVVEFGEWPCEDGAGQNQARQ